jgi:RNA polymerase sigma-70 factor, ECF subfamily
MMQQSDLTEQFDGARTHLRAVAFRMLGSADEADDAVQEAWLRASQAGADGVVNVTGWLTTIVSRICLDALRARRRRHADLLDGAELERVAAGGASPEDEAVLADSVGLALLVVLDALGPGERVAFVLHDLFAVPFDDIAPIVDRSPSAAKKLASRARQRVHGAGATAVPSADFVQQRRVVEAFLAASRDGDLDALLAVLAPDAVRRADTAALLLSGRPTTMRELRGARAIAEETRTNAEGARYARPVLIDGRPGAVVAPRGRLLAALNLTIEGDHITVVEVLAEPDRLRRLHFAVLD